MEKGQTREGNYPKVTEKRTYQSINETLLKEPLLQLLDCWLGQSTTYFSI